MRLHATGGRIAVVSALALATILAPASAPARAQQAGYLDHSALGSELRALASSSDAATLDSIGSSLDGREVWMLTIGAPGGAALDERPGVLLVGNLSGDHVVGSALALEAARHLLTSDDDAVVAARAERVFYVVPRVNPDGAEAMFGAPLQGRRGNARPQDDDNDGRDDEDGADDLNGDGLVTLMRVADPYGDYLPHPDDPRLMKRAEPAKGERGTHSLYLEGRDDDGDGFYNEDGVGGVDLDRNFQHAYPYWQADAGVHMVSEPETRALMDFVIAHRNIGAILTFGHSDNLVTPPDGQGELGGFATSEMSDFAAASVADVFEVGVFEQPRRGFFGGGPRLRGAQRGRDNDPSSGRRPATSVNREDLEYFTAVSEAYREITGITAVATNREPEGAFFQYGYFHFGVPSFSTPGWGLPETASVEDGADEGATMQRRGGGRGGDSAGADARLLGALGDDAFVAWSEYEHPQLGTVEIGGFRPYATTNPDAARVAELGAAHGRFAARLAGMLADVSIVSTSVTGHGGAVFTVTAEVENSGYFPTALAHGMVARSVDPVTVQIGVDPAAVLTGADKTATTGSLAGSGGREKFTWVIRGDSGDEVEIRLLTQKGGRDTASVTLR